MRPAAAVLLLLPLAATACHAHGPCGRYLPAAEGDIWSYRTQNGVVHTATITAVVGSGASFTLRSLDANGYGPTTSFELSCRGEVDLRTASSETGFLMGFHDVLPAPDAIAVGAKWHGELRRSDVLAVPIKVDMTPGASKIPVPIGTPIRALDVTTAESRIEREEEVTVAAGTFHALRVEMDQRTMRLGSPGQFPSRRIVWLARDVGPVKIEDDHTMPDGSIAADVAELTAYHVR